MLVSVQEHQHHRGLFFLLIAIPSSCLPRIVFPSQSMDLSCPVASFRNPYMSCPIVFCAQSGACVCVSASGRACSGLKQLLLVLLFSYIAHLSETSAENGLNYVKFVYFALMTRGLSSFATCDRRCISAAQVADHAAPLTHR